MPNGLGRGLSSLIPPKQNKFAATAAMAASSPELQKAATLQIRDLPVMQIDPNPLQPRQNFDPKSLAELRASIAEYGLLEPIVVTPEGGRWLIVAGERRYRAIKELGHPTIPAIIRTASELERLELGLIENIQREDLNPIERASGIAKLVNDFGLTQEQAAKKLGKARSSIANIIRLLDLPTEIQLGLAAGKITEGHAKTLLSIPTNQERVELYHKILASDGSMSVRELEANVAAAHQQLKSVKTFSAASAAYDHEMHDLAERLQQALGTKVRLKRKIKGAQIVIDAYSKEELKAVIRKITGTS